MAWWSLGTASFHPPESCGYQQTYKRPSCYRITHNSPTRCISIIQSLWLPFLVLTLRRQHPHTFSDFQAWFLVYSASTSSGFSRDSRMRGSLSELVLHKKCHQLLPKHFTQHNYPNMGLKTWLLFQVDLSMPPESIIKCQPSSACLSDGSPILVGEKIQGLISFFHF